MRTRTYESAPPRLALAFAALALAAASLGGLVMLPAIAAAPQTTAAFAARPADLSAARAGPRDARSATNDAQPVKRGT